MTFLSFYEGSVYVSQNLKFVAPVFVGSYVTARIEVVDVRLRGKLIKCKTTCLSHGFDYPGELSPEGIIQGGSVVFRGGTTMPHFPFILYSLPALLSTCHTPCDYKTAGKIGEIVVDGEAAVLVEKA